MRPLPQPLGSMSPTPRRRVRSALVAASLLAILAGVAAEEPASAPTFETFDALRRHHGREAFRATADYLTRRPDAPDSEQAYRFLFETALAEGLSTEARPHAERFLSDRADPPADLRSLARRVTMTALALGGETDAAIDLLGEEIATVRRQSPSAAIDAAAALASAAQRAGKPEAARQAYERLRRGFFLNPTVEAVCGNRLARLELVSRSAPPVGPADLAGRPAPDLKTSGRVVLVDFWATNCPPCLEELPALKRLHAEFGPSGFEIVAVSLDEDAATVRDYLERHPVPWPVFLSKDDADATRQAYRVETIPANFLIGPDGTVLRVDLHGPDLRAEVERLAGESAD